MILLTALGLLKFTTVVLFWSSYIEILAWFPSTGSLLQYETDCV